MSYRVAMKGVTFSRWSTYTCTAAIQHDWKLAWKDWGAIAVWWEHGM